MREGSEQSVFAIDEDSGRIVDTVGEGGGMSLSFSKRMARHRPPPRQLTDYLRVLEHDQALTRRAVAVIAEAGVIKPWPLKVPLGKETVTVSGLHRVDEEALNALDDATFLKLRKASSLVIAYGQILSVGQVKVLRQASEPYAGTDGQGSAVGTLPV